MTAPLVSIVIPTLREAQNLRPLAKAIDDSMVAAGITYEIVFVDDDSQDGSQAIFADLQTSGPIRAQVRRQQKGLASAVTLGAQLAQSEIVAVMDADLSHPAAKLPALVQAVATDQCDMAIGSRYLPQSTIRGFPWPRKSGSFIARFLARPLTGVSDPMSGFFVCKKQLFFSEGLVKSPPQGYKILLELLARNRQIRVYELPIDFAPRRYGESKLRFKQKLQFLLQWARLLATRLYFGDAIR